MGESPGEQMNAIQIEVTETRPITINIDEVECVYSGTPHRCTCGCAGNYFYAERHREHATKRRGYKVDDKDINDTMIKKVLKIFAESKEPVECIQDYIFTIIVNGNRQYTIYLVRREEQ